MTTTPRLLARGGRLVPDVTAQASTSRWLPAACGALAFVLVLFVWGSLDKVAIGSDEAAYLLQARIFASGHLVAAGRPLPEFFQQFHVFVTPVLAGKYPPGHPLLLALGVWLGLPGLIPAICVALGAALLCSIAQRFTNGAVAVLAVLLMCTSDIALRFNPSYFSETTTSLMLVVGWWSLLEYGRSRRLRWLLVCTASFAYGGITRPLTMLACAMPVAVYAFVFIWRRRAWRDLVPAVAIAVPILVFLGVWNHAVVGHWYRMPWAEYARLYVPSDRLGFGQDSTPPAAHLTADEEATNQVYWRLHLHYTIDRLPSVAVARAGNIIRGTWSYGGVPALAILLGVGLLPIGVVRLLIGTVLSVFLAYLSFDHDSTWTLYYLELQPALALLTAVGLYGAASFVSRAVSRFSRRVPLNPRNVSRAAAFGLSLWVAVPALPRVLTYRHLHAEHRRYREQFANAVTSLGPAPAVVFVRYAAGHGEERLVDNVPDLLAAKVWIVHDCGRENSRLLGLAPTRTPYLYEEWPDSVGFRMRISRMIGVEPDTTVTDVEPRC